MTHSDKIADKYRYNDHASQLSINRKDYFKAIEEFSWLKEPLKEPYYYYRQSLKKNLQSGSKVLEIGSGTGLHTLDILKCNVELTATDISSESLDFLSQIYEHDIKTQIADMETLPFEDNLFDAVCGAGVLSYGDHKIVRDEIYRVLKPNGIFICVDSLDHNPIYKINRFIHYLRGKRSLSSVRRIPRYKTLDLYGEKFEIFEQAFFGSLSWLSSLITLFLDKKRSAQVLNQLERSLNMNKMAFKFVSIFKKKLP